MDNDLLIVGPLSLITQQLTFAYHKICAAAGFLALLDEPENDLKLFALQKLDEVLTVALQLMLFKLLVSSLVIVLFVFFPVVNALLRGLDFLTMLMLFMVIALLGLLVLTATSETRIALASLISH